MDNSESITISECSSIGDARSPKRSSEEFESWLNETANKEISDEEISLFWRTEIYGKESMKRMLMLDKLVREKASEANLAMINFTEYVLKVKEDNAYQQLGYSKFEDWVQNHGISMSTVNSWQKVYDVYIKRYGFTLEEISNYDIKKLKIILPLAELEMVTKERVEELFELILFMCESDLRLSVKEEIALTLSEAESNP